MIAMHVTLKAGVIMFPNSPGNKITTYYNNKVNYFQTLRQPCIWAKKVKENSRIINFIYLFIDQCIVDVTSQEKFKMSAKQET